MGLNSFFRFFSVRPVFVREPDDVITTSGATITFVCEAEGDPEPRIRWFREEITSDGSGLDGSVSVAEIGLPRGRAVIKEGMLIVERIGVKDEGLYVCEAENGVGPQPLRAAASLSVHVHPAFMAKPKDQRVGMNGIATFQCVAEGNPLPSVFWTKEGSQELMFAGTTHGAMRVSSDGTLTLQGVRKEDAGFYVCSALSVAGSSVTKAYLEVTAIEDQPPPVITTGPANQTLPVNTIAVLPCEAFGSPKPSIKWLKNETPLTSEATSRILVEPSGTLVIDSKIELHFSSVKRTLDNFFPLFQISRRPIRLYTLAQPAPRAAKPLGPPRSPSRTPKIPTLSSTRRPIRRHFRNRRPNPQSSSAGPRR